MIKSFKEMMAVVKNKDKKIKLVVAVAQDEYVLEAVYAAFQSGIAEAILVGNKEEILALENQCRIPEDTFRIVDVQGNLAKQCAKAVELVLKGEGQALMKGLVDTSILLKEVLNHKTALLKGELMSLVTVFEIPKYDKLLLMSDAGVVIAPTLVQKQQIILNALTVMKVLKIKEPKVAVICAIEKVDPKMPATEDAEELVRMNQDGIIKDCIIIGPVALDIAVNVAAAQHKGIADPVAGDVDLIVMPFIEAGNVFYKTMVQLGDAKLASVVTGASIPIVVTSRSDDAESKMYSIALAALLVSEGKMKYSVLAINPGSTSTKIAVFENNDEVFKTNISHPVASLAKFNTVAEQFPLRLETIVKVLEEAHVDLTKLHAVVGRGGFIKPVPSGIYQVNDQMVADLRHSWREHASNLGGLIAKEIADKQGIPAFIVDPPVVDEMEEVARISGLNGVERKSVFHALNHKAVARKLAHELRKGYDESSLIIAHMGGGITVGAHKNGRVIDVNNGIDGDGPFTPERSGSLPAGNMIRMCFGGEHTEKEVYQKIIGKGGIVSYLGTNDVREVERLALGHDVRASLVLEALAYQVAKEIGAYAAVLTGDVDGIALTGGLAFSQRLTEAIIKRVKFIAPVYVYPGEMEMEALAEGALRVLMGLEKPKNYSAN